MRTSSIWLQCRSHPRRSDSAKAESIFGRTIAKINLIRNVFPVPPGASKPYLLLKNATVVLAIVHPQSWLLVFLNLQFSVAHLNVLSRLIDERARSPGAVTRDHRPVIDDAEIPYLAPRSTPPFDAMLAINHNINKRIGYMYRVFAGSRGA
ncbi:hypothetical protein EVAR_84433_1 [Eumeta japonica]|uniref:Uncharacterized protein n=1 Tax=Eumeta variegata TaxID=151549 RepID=A0A4C1W313_EUMVA|nr:hypothetical protein EVAR_84433_1 [Eumeta japonica]